MVSNHVVIYLKCLKHFHFYNYSTDAFLSFDIGLHSYSGNVTLPFMSDKPATHALVFILHGITTPWKQTVAYYFTPDATPGHLLWQVIDL